MIMNKKRKAGIWFLVWALLLVALNVIFNMHNRIAKKLCGDAYMIEPDPELRAQDILSESACGFDSDMYIGALFFLLVLWGVALLLMSFKK